MNSQSNLRAGHLNQTLVIEAVYLIWIPASGCYDTVFQFSRIWIDSSVASKAMIQYHSKQLDSNAIRSGPRGFRCGRATDQVNCKLLNLVSFKNWRNFSKESDPLNCEYQKREKTHTHTHTWTSALLNVCHLYLAPTSSLMCYEYCRDLSSKYIGGRDLY